jgi:autotransporter translocation and assembly factor TamB
MDIKNGKVRLSFEGQKLKVDEASILLAGGTIRRGGDVTLAPLAAPAMNRRLDAGQALIVRDNTMSLRADANITCTGTLKKADVAGRVYLVRGRVFKEIEFLPLSLPEHIPPPPPPVTPSSKQTSLPPPFSDWTFNVDITTRDPIRLMGNVLNGAAVVDMHVRGNGAAPVIEGTTKLQDSHVHLPFSRLNISRGVITFDKEHPLDPTLDVQGDALVNNYEVTVYAYGSALSPKTRFSSSPPLSESDIATLLATGSTAGDARTAENVAGNAAAFLVISRLYRSLFDKAAPKRYNQEPAKLSFSFSPLDTSGNGRSVTAIYEINPKLQAQGTVTDRGTFRGLLYYLFRFH